MLRDILHLIFGCLANLNQRLIALDVIFVVFCTTLVGR